MAEDRLAVAVLDAVDHRRLDLLAAIGEHRIGRNHPQHRGFAGAERHGKHRQHLVVDAEALGIFGNEVHAHVVGKPHRHQVARLLDAEAQRRGAGRTAAVVFRPPDLAARDDLERGVENDGGRRIAVVERRRVDEGLEGRAGLAHRLRRAIEFRLRRRKSRRPWRERGRFAGPWQPGRPEPSAAGAAGIRLPSSVGST